jgi:hypothetical protein
MAIRPPRLDDRAYDDLRAELVRRIPVHAPEWTDHNATDPGITLIELFAFLGDNLLYRLNRAPEASKLAFLQLLNLPPRPAQSAVAQVRLDLQPGAVEPLTPDFSPAAPKLQLTAGDVIFQPVEEITVLPVELSAWIKRPVAPLPPEGVTGVQQLLEDHLGLAQGAGPALSAYEATPLPAPKGGAIPPATSTSAAIDRGLWLALLAPDKVLKALDAGDPAATLELVRRRIAGKPVSLGFRVDDTLCGPTDHRRCPDPGGPAATRWPVRWDISTGGFTGAARRVDRVAFERLAVSGDATEGLTRSGVVRLRLPDVRGDGSLRFGDWTADSFDPPDPDLLGVGGLPPRLEDPKLAARVLAWIRVRRMDPDDPPIRLRLAEANVVTAEQAVSAAPEMLGWGDGRSAQRLTVSKAPVIAGSEMVQVSGASGWEAWTPVEDLALAGPDDPFYALDPTEGAIVFGDGVHGRIPLPGQAIRCLGYRYGGGAGGNVGAAAISKVRGAPLKATNTLAAEGGVDAETLEQAQARIPKMLRARDRAVCAEDFEQIALETPGPAVGRAEVLARHKPFERADGIPGVVTLVVLPAHDPETPDTPTPDKEMLRRVCAWLEPRRLVTTELYVTPPEYAPVDVSVAVEPEPGTGEETLRRWVELAVRQHFAPLPPYGPDGTGWPFGRAVRDRDAEAAVLRVQGVRLVNEVVLQGEAIGPDGTRTNVTGTLPLRSWQLPVIRHVAVALGPQAPPLAPEPPPPADGMPVPVEREEC